MRENTEGEYAGLEHRVVPGVVESIKITTERACTRIARFAFAHAAAAGRKKVTAVHKANIMKRSDGLFLECCRAVAKEYPAIAFQELIVDNTCMQLVMNPYQFDVMVMQNFYGDLVSDLCAGLAGGLGVVPSASFGDDLAVFEAIYEDAPGLAAHDTANPLTLLVSALALLRHLGLDAAAERITTRDGGGAERGPHVTRDLGGTRGHARDGRRDHRAAVGARIDARCERGVRLRCARCTTRIQNVRPPWYSVVATCQIATT